MKKNVLRVLAGIMTVFMMFAMTACSEPAEQPSTEVEQPVNDVEQPVEQAEESEAAKAVAAYVEACRDQVAQMNTDDTFEIKVVAKGTAVVYEYTYNSIDNLTDEDRAFMKQALEDEVDKNKETVQKSLETIKSEEPNVTAMVFEYYEKSGKLIASIEIK